MIIKKLVWLIKDSTRLFKISICFPGSISRKYRFLKYAILARHNGVVYLRVERVASEFVNSWYAMSDMSPSEKKWYIKHGFNPKYKYYCGVRPENYKLFLSDFEFYKRDNYVNKNALWFDNKLNTYYLLYPFSNNLPKHYFYISGGGGVFPLDIIDKHNSSPDGVISLLMNKKLLAAKKCTGGHGDGFLKLEYENDSIVVNGKIMLEDEFRLFINSLDGYLITEFVKPAKWLRQLAGENSSAVMRVMTIYDEIDGPQFLRAMIRIGTGKSGPTQAGYDILYAGIDDNGVLFGCFYEYSDYCWERMENHPETGEVINGRIMPNMEELKQLCKTVSGYLPCSPYLIFDIIPSDNSFKILEINSHGQPFLFEPFDPVKGSEYFTRLFKVDQ